MKKAFLLKSVAIALAVAVLFSGCASSTMINSSPAGAKVYINGESVGTTPYLYTDTKVLGSVINIDLVKEGYEPLYTSFTRSEQVNAGAIVGGLFFLFPFLWTMEYKPTHNYELVPLAATNQDTQVQSEQTQPALSKVQRLKELKQMLDENLITQDEFNKAKQKILDEK
ncbi:MAG: PEGA domain-containing protein [Paludibacter sp.]